MKFFKSRKLKIFVSLFILWLLLHSAYVIYDGLHDWGGSADVAIVLGNSVFADSTLSPWLQGRVEAALKLYKAGRVKRIFVSGGKGEYGVHEGDAMQKYLVRNNIPQYSIITDNNGNNSYLTAKDFILLNDSLHFNSAIVVSSFYHITRCKYIIKKLGFKNVEGFSSDKYFWQDAYGLLREFFAFYKYVIFY
ncbi:MAG TPA: YdcF family protein [Puia sp.]|jgi:vancomycin permeability regulator SanA|nr:YdcF family protein [Puia sp.]